MKQLAGKKTVQDLLLIIIGSGLTALPVKCIYDPLDMVTGGFSGLSIIIKALTSWIVAGGSTGSNLFCIKCADLYCGIYQERKRICRKILSCNGVAVCMVSDHSAN